MLKNGYGHNEKKAENITAPLAMTVVTAGVGAAQSTNLTFQIDVYEGEARALYVGDIFYGSVEALREVLDAHPRIQLLGLNSAGGNIKVGKELFFLIRERGLSTFAWQQCSSACTLAFMGGRERFVEQGTTIGFHTGDGGGQRDHFDAGTSFASRARPLAEIVGIDLGFVEYAYSTDASSVFVPSNETLLQNRFATGLVSKFHVADPIVASYDFEADPFSYAAKAFKDQKWQDAARYLEKAIETEVSFPSAHFIFGYLNENALGVEQNYSRAVELYEVASNAGHPQANHNLGLMLLHGKGVAEDRERGIELVRRAAGSGDVYAQFNLARWYTDGRYGELDLSKALLLLGECANAGDLECQLELANRYIEGEGTARDLRKAHAWYSEALRQMVESNQMKDTVRAQIAWINDRLPE